MTYKSTLKSILNVTRNQFKYLRTGVIYSDFMVLVRKERQDSDAGTADVYLDNK